VFVPCALAAVLTACGVLKAPPALPTGSPSHSNVLVNGGFEAGADGWAPVLAEAAGPVDVVDGSGHGGRRSLALRLSGNGTAGTGRTIGATQTVNTEAFPEMVSGFYRVDRWQPNAASQNVRFVVSVRGGDFGDGLGVHVVRFIVAGSDAAAALLPGVAQTYLSRAAPLRRWTYFGYPVKQAFADRFGKAPTRWDAMEISVEAGYDGETGGGPGAAAEVSFDDVYAGPLAQNPNHPADP